jgi:hypothetical protein
VLGLGQEEDLYSWFTFEIRNPEFLWTVCNRADAAATEMESVVVVFGPARRTTGRMNLPISDGLAPWYAASVVPVIIHHHETLP